MLDRYAVQKLVHAGVKAREVARQIGTSVRSVRRILREDLSEGSAATNAEPKRGVGRPRVRDAIRAFVRTLLEDEPEIPPGEVHRRLREAGMSVDLSTTYRVLASARATIPTEADIATMG